MNSSILTYDMNHCYLCGVYLPKGERHMHEIYYGSANRKKSKKWDCCVPLCVYCHNKAHHDHDIDYDLKVKCQIEFEKLHGFVKFMEVFHRNYL